MLNIKRVSVKDKVSVENVVYIGRANKTYSLSPNLLANPYVIGKDGDRDEVVEKYRRWLWSNIKEELESKDISYPNYRNKVFAELKRLQILAREINVNNIINSTDNSLTLMCWCKSNEKCHGDVIINCLNWMETNHVGE